MNEERHRILSVAYAIAQADNEQIDGSEMGMHFWGKYASHYLLLAEKAIAANQSLISEDEALYLDREINR